MMNFMYCTCAWTCTCVKIVCIGNYGITCQPQESSNRRLRAVLRVCHLNGHKLSQSLSRQIAGLCLFACSVLRLDAVQYS